ncbi:MAG: AzlC family ABC transporter permease [Burkholderiaceae bacterium]
MTPDDAVLKTPVGTKASFRTGVFEGVFGPGLGTFAAMIGFGSLAGDAGTPLWAAVTLALGVWSMPGQVAFVELSASEVSVLFMLVIVMVATIRSLPLTIATMPMLRHTRGARPSHFLLAHLNSVTSYIRLGELAITEKNVHARVRFFTGFAGGSMVTGVIGTVLGYTLAENLPPAGVQAMIFVTPMYLLLLTARSPRAEAQLAVLAGVILVPAFSLWIGNLGIVVGGLVAGSLAFFAVNMRRK